MEDKANFIEPLIERLEKYSETSFELFKLKALEKTADIASTFVSRSIVLLALLMFIFIANIGIALWLGDLLGKLYYGFFCVAGFYGIVGIIVYLMNKHIKNQVSNSIISHLLK